MKYLSPRRFSEVWQMDAEWPGTLAQQAAIRDAFAITYGTRQWQLMKALDQTANHVWGRSYLVVGFPPDDMWSPQLLAVAGVTGMNFRASYVPTALPLQALHELGHVVDKHLLTQTERVWFMHEISGPDLGDNRWNWNYQETFADAFRQWWLGTGWESLTTVLLGEETPPIEAPALT